MTIDEKLLDEAIQHAREVADKNSDCWKHCINDGSCSVCEKEHEQLVELLEELKKRRSEDYGYMADIHQSIGYRKVLDDIKEELMKNEFICTQHALDVFDGIAKQCGVSDDVCEWKFDGVYLISPHKQLVSCVTDENYLYYYCPICGKKIKEVE